MLHLQLLRCNAQRAERRGDQYKVYNIKWRAERRGDQYKVYNIKWRAERRGDQYKV